MAPVESTEDNQRRVGGEEGCSGFPPSLPANYFTSFSDAALATGDSDSSVNDR